MKDSDSVVRMQVPVTGELAEELNELASRMDRSVSWLAVAMLCEVLDDRKRTAEWLSSYVLGVANDAKKFVTGKRRRKAEASEAVRLQLSVPASVGKEIGEIAERMTLTPVKMAGVLLQTAVNQNTIVIEAITSKPMRALLGKPSRGGGAGQPKGKARYA